MIKKWILTESDTSENDNKKIRQNFIILRMLAQSKDALSIPNIAERIKLSVPTVTRLIVELKENGLVIEEGKVVTESGRKPVVYTIQKNRFYSVGVEILLKKIQVSIANIDLHADFFKQNTEFTLENTKNGRDEICNFINDAINASEIKKENIIGIGIGITGRVNSLTGTTFNFFEFDNTPLADYIENKLNLPTIVENDTRVIGMYESVAGKVQNSSNALIVNISSGIGMTVIANGKIISGNSGFAGEFGHMQFAGTKNRACICGKKGCLDTEVSGKALEVEMKEALENGEHSIRFSSSSEKIHYDEIIDAANEGDLLSVTLLQKQGEKLGSALGNIINLINPEIIVISGKYSKIESFFASAVNSGLYKTGLKNPLSDCEVVSSDLSIEGGSIGAAAMVFKKQDLL